MTLHSDILRYLKQQRELFGNTTYVDRSRGVDISAVDLRIVSEPTPVAQVVSYEMGEGVAGQRTASWADASDLTVFHQMICGCMDCPLGATRTNFVFGSGNPSANLMIVGEAPGADEDEQGLPFVGRAGQLLTKILAAIEIERDDVYICNILKCRPPNNRKPLASETDACEPYLWKQIELVQPKYILALGLTAANTLLKNKESMTSLRGRVHDYQGIPMVVTYHPAALLRNPEWKKSTWEDVQQLAQLLQQS